jgi:hypothetical protein
MLQYKLIFIHKSPFAIDYRPHEIVLEPEPKLAL